MTLFVISWFLVGFIVMVASWVNDMRGIEFDEHYFDAGTIALSLLILLLGYISMIICCYIYVNNHKPFTKLIYKLANIGIKKEDNSEE